MKTEKINRIRVSIVNVLLLLLVLLQHWRCAIDVFQLMTIFYLSHFINIERMKKYNNNKRMTIFWCANIYKTGKSKKTILKKKKKKVSLLFHIYIYIYIDTTDT